MRRTNIKYIKSYCKSFGFLFRKSIACHQRRRIRWHVIVLSLYASKLYMLPKSSCLISALRRTTTSVRKLIVLSKTIKKGEANSSVILWEGKIIPLLSIMSCKKSENHVTKDKNGNLLQVMVTTYIKTSRVSTRWRNNGFYNLAKILCSLLPLGYIVLRRGQFMSIRGEVHQYTSRNIPPSRFFFPPHISY